MRLAAQGRERDDAVEPCTRAAPRPAIPRRPWVIDERAGRWSRQRPRRTTRVIKCRLTSVTDVVSTDAFVRISARLVRTYAVRAIRGLESHVLLGAAGDQEETQPCSVAGGPGQELIQNIPARVRESPGPKVQLLGQRNWPACPRLSCGEVRKVPLLAWCYQERQAAAKSRYYMSNGTKCVHRPAGRRGASAACNP